jgi:hypothetical protein
MIGRNQRGPAVTHLSQAIVDRGQVDVRGDLLKHGPRQFQRTVRAGLQMRQPNPGGGSDRFTNNRFGRLGQNVTATAS